MSAREHPSRLGTLLVGLLAALAPAPLCGVARADGVRCESRIDLQGLVEQSRAILLAEVISTEHSYREVEAYGRKQRYLADYRFQARLVRVIRGGTSGVGRRFWIEMRGEGAPGEWTLVRACYPRTLRLEEARPGDRLLVFGRQEIAEVGENLSNGEPLPVYASELDGAALLPAVEQAARRTPKSGGATPSIGKKP